MTPKITLDSTIEALRELGFNPHIQKSQGLGMRNGYVLRFEEPRVHRLCLVFSSSGEFLPRPSYLRRSPIFHV